MTKSNYQDPYAVLGVAPTATAAEIKKAYFQLVRDYPPEKDSANFKRIRAAYEKVRDPEKRLESDMHRLNVWPQASQKRRLPQIDLSLQPDDILLAAEHLSDLNRKDWREYYKKITL